MIIIVEYLYRQAGRLGVVASHPLFNVSSNGPGIDQAETRNDR
jgi:hypothetical protein